MDQQSSPERQPLSEMEKLQYNLYSLFIEHDPDAPAPWSLRRYVEGRRENIFDISYSSDIGGYALSANITDPSSKSGYEVIEDTLTPDERFSSGRKAEAGDEDYGERRAKQFNDLLIRSTDRPYGRLGRMLLRARYRFAI